MIFFHVNIDTQEHYNPYKTEDYQDEN